MSCNHRDDSRGLSETAIRDWVKLDLIPVQLHGLAIEALYERDACGFLVTADNTLSLEILYQNADLLLSLGIYEDALVHALTATRSNNFSTPPKGLRWLIRLADRRRLRDLYPIPSPGPHLLYRGVSGRGRARRIRGLSWSRDLDTACWFACGSRYSFENPAVFCGDFNTRHVLAYDNDRGEEEFIVDVPAKLLLRQPLSSAEIAARAQAVTERRKRTTLQTLGMADGTDTGGRS
jgi:hypothetical protein